jgi:hypothetical protein
MIGSLLFVFMSVTFLTAAAGSSQIISPLPSIRQSGGPSQQCEEQCPSLSPSSGSVTVGLEWLESCGTLAVPGAAVPDLKIAIPGNWEEP